MNSTVLVWGYAEVGGLSHYERLEKNLGNFGSELGRDLLQIVPFASIPSVLMDLKWEEGHCIHQSRLHRPSRPHHTNMIWLQPIALFSRG